MANELPNLFILVGLDLRGAPSIRIHQFEQALFKNASEAGPGLFFPVVPARGVLQKNRQPGINVLDDGGFTHGCETASLVQSAEVSSAGACSMCPFHPK